jgi:hypothetical protein
MRRFITLVLLSTLAVGLCELPVEARDNDGDIALQFEFWREKNDEGKQEYIEISFNDDMANVLWVKNTGNIPISQIKLKVTVLMMDAVVKSVPGALRRFLPKNEGKMEREYEVNLEPGEEIVLRDRKPLSEWIIEEADGVGAKVTKTDAKTTTIWADKKLGPATVNAEVDIGGRSKAVASVYVYDESSDDWVSCGKRVYYYRMVPAKETPEPPDGVIDEAQEPLAGANDAL